MNEELIELIKKNRINKGLSQAEIAREVGISQPSYGRLENGESHININTLIKICSVLDMSISTILRKIYRDSDAEYLEKVEENKRLKSSLERRENYVKLLSYNISDTMREIERFERKDISLEDLKLKLESLKINLEIITKHEIL